MVPGLRGIVEERGLVGLASAGGDELDERLAFEGRAGDESGGVVGVGLVVLAVVVAEGVGREHRVEGVECVGEVGEEVRALGGGPGAEWQAGRAEQDGAAGGEEEVAPGGLRGGVSHGCS